MLIASNRQNYISEKTHMDWSIGENRKQLLNKVPEVTIFFWFIKILATTVGETAADFLNFNLHLGLTGTSVVMSVLLAAFLIAQICARKYVPWLYWVVVVLISVVGTLISDNLVDNLGVSLETTTIGFSLALLATFVIWYAVERSLSIHSIVTTRRELFYWGAILFTFSLGTAAGDLIAEGMKLGYSKSALLFSGLIVVTALAYFLFKANVIATFWIAYILTRPLGASCGDLLAQPQGSGGFGLGTTVTSSLFLAAIAGLVLYLSLTRRMASVSDAKLGG